MIDAVVSHHLNPFRSGVARFNELLAEHLGVPFAGLSEGRAYREPLLSFKVSELGDSDAAVLEAGLADWPEHDVFLHELAGTDLETRLIASARRVLCGNREIAERLRGVHPEVVELWTPGLIVENGRIAPVDVRVFTFGMAHKIRTDAFGRLRDLLDASGRSYAVRVSAANHETAELRDAELVFEEMHRLFPQRLYFLGNLSDLAIVHELERATFFAAFFPGGVRANNTSVASAMERGAVVITNLDESSPPELRHLDNMLDLNRLDVLPDDPLVLRSISARAMQTGRERSWGHLVARNPAMSRDERIRALAYRPHQQPHEVVRACNLCGSEHHVEVARRDRYGYPVTLRVCADCGLGFLSPRPTAEAYGAFYRDIYRPLVSAYHGRRIDAETVQDEQRGYAADLAAWVSREHGGAPRSVLDVGGSTGIVAAAFAHEGVTVTVLDPAPDELAVAAAAGMEVVEGFAEDFDPGEQRWELVLLCQTIDHLLDVTATLSAIRGLLAEGGRAFVDVLDVSWVLARQGTIEGAYKIDHPYYLTRATAVAYFARCGLEVVAERMADDGHWGFLLAPGERHEPDRPALRRGADAFLSDVWRRRAEAR